MGSSSAVANRGKRSVVVDAATDEGVAIVKRLAETADVFVQCVICHNHHHRRRHRTPSLQPL
eukprot:COSAG04_NODE_31293_length_257_cov_0.981013_1_plen_61_part_10